MADNDMLPSAAGMMMDDGLRDRGKRDDFDKHKYAAINDENNALKDADDAKKKSHRAARTLEMLTIGVIMVLVIMVVIGCVLYIIKKDKRTIREILEIAGSNVGFIHADYRQAWYRLRRLQVPGVAEWIEVHIDRTK